MDIRAYNREMWDRFVEQGNEWTLPVSPEIIAAARQGQWEIVLTAMKPVPKDWLGAVRGKEILCLASGGGQQGPVLSAAGARVTILDNSPRQLAQDRQVAEREGLDLETVEGDMRDLSMFPDGRFDLVVNPVSNLFVPDVHPVWRESFRVLQPGGRLLAGFMNPVFYLFDRELLDDEGIIKVRFRLPYSDLTSISEEERQRLIQEGWPVEFGHMLTDQIGGQIQAGFVIIGLYEDKDPRGALMEYMPVYIATLALKPAHPWEL